MLLALLVVAIVLFVVLPLLGLALWALLSTLLVGLVVGGLARLVIPGRQPIGVLATILLGIVGSLVGGGIGRGVHAGRLGTILLEIAVAAAGVAVYSGVQRRRALSGGYRRGIDTRY